MFIISNPRCGTTFLHRLLNLDSERYISTVLYHTILPCVLYIKTISWISNIDLKIGGPLHKLLEFFDNIVYKGWKDIHPMGFNKTEEDEGLFNIIMFSPALTLITPWAYKMNYLNFLDNADEKLKEKISVFYKTSLQRIVYAKKPNATLLMKNVFSTGRLNFVLSCFPNAKIIYPIRNPYDAIPSVISMFTSPWSAHSPEIPKNSEEHRAFGQVAIDYYKYLYKEKNSIKKENLMIIMYADIVSNPIKTVYNIYSYFNFELSPNFKVALDPFKLKSKNYKSKHKYSLEEYGLSKEYISSELSVLMKEYGFLS